MRATPPHLKDERLSRLRARTLDAIQFVRVNDGNRLDVLSLAQLMLAEKEISESDARIARLRKDLGDRPFFTFAANYLQRRLVEWYPYEPGSPAVPLSSVTGFEDPGQIASQIVTEYASLPWPCLSAVEFPKALGQKLSTAFGLTYDLSDELALVTPSREFDENFPLHTGIEGRDRRLFGGARSPVVPVPRTWDTDNVYLMQKFAGFVDVDGGVASASRPLDVLVAFFGFCLAVRLMRFGRTGVPAPFDTGARQYQSIHREIDEVWEIIATTELPADLTTALDRLDIDDLEGRIGEEKIPLWIRDRLALIAVAFRNRAKAGRLIRASRRLLESHLGEDDLFRLLKASLAMKILFGGHAESDARDPGELVRNRCAYLIGASDAQRRELLNELEHIDRVRDEAEHRGQSRLPSEEAGMLQKLQRICGRAITRELELLKKLQRKGGK